MKKCCLWCTLDARKNVELKLDHWITGSLDHQSSAHQIVITLLLSMYPSHGSMLCSIFSTQLSCSMKIRMIFFLPQTIRKSLGHVFWMSTDYWLILLEFLLVLTAIFYFIVLYCVVCAFICSDFISFVL